jgi:hypothetical protein
MDQIRPFFKVLDSHPGNLLNFPEFLFIKNFPGFLFIKKFTRDYTGHSKKSLWTVCGGGGIFGILLPQIYKKCNRRGEGEGSKCEKKS